jgi:hypothetical protein
MIESVMSFVKLFDVPYFLKREFLLAADSYPSALASILAKLD